MKPSSFFNINGIKTIEDVKKVLSNTLTNYFQILDKRIGYLDNIDCFIVEVFLPSAVITKIPHSLGKTPIGYLVINNDNVNQVYVSPSSPWTDEAVYFYSGNNNNVKIVLLGS